MQERYLMIVMVVFAVVMFGSMAIESYQKNQCKQAAIQAGKSADEINKICM